MEGVTPLPEVLERMKLDGFARFAWGVLAYNLAVILWGAYVRATGSGAGCGSHWPLCNGEVVPRAAGTEMLIELTHRTTSGIALVAVVALWVFAWRRFPAGHVVRRGATLSLFFIIVEALLGAGLVLFELVAEDDSWFRALSMIAHLVNTFLLVAVLTLTAWWASGGERVRLAGQRGSRAWVAGAIAILAVGATGAIAALGDTLFPSASVGEGLRESFSSESHPLLQLRKYHPLLAILVGGYLAAFARHLSRTRPSAAVDRAALTVIALYGAQILAGVVNILLLAPVFMQLLHLLLADLVWIAYVVLAAAVFRAGPRERVETSEPAETLAGAAGGRLPLGVR